LEHQLNPHLLFNSLGFIYNSVHENSPKAAECVLLLSDIMSFSLHDKSDDGKVPLSGEVEQIRRLIDINRYRFDKALSIGVNLNGSFEKFRIIPLILFTLTENLFKHGNVLNTKFPALLSITVDSGGLLVFQSSNLKRPENEFIPGRKIGLKNVRLRLDFAYPNNYQLTISEDEDFYKTTLTINL
jgi:two-component system LytT family sensor kinase